MSGPTASEQGVSVIVHDVRLEHRADYERWMSKAASAHRQCLGYLAMDVIRPVGDSMRYVVVLRFSSAAGVNAWLVSPIRRQLLEEARPWLLQQDRYHVYDNAEFWFQPAGAGRMPKRWKQWLISALAVFPLTTVIPPFLRSAAGMLTPSLPGIAVSAVSALTISGLMVYWLMPMLSRAAAAWLSR